MKTILHYIKRFFECVTDVTIILFNVTMVALVGWLVYYAWISMEIIGFWCVLVIPYLVLGLVIGCFANDSGKCPTWLALLIIFFWPAFFVVLGILELLGIVKE